MSERGQNHVCGCPSASRRGGVWLNVSSQLFFSTRMGRSGGCCWPQRSRWSSRSMRLSREHSKTSRHRYWLLVADGPILIELAESDGDIYGRLTAHDPGDPLNRLADLPHHERSLWQDADDIVPLKPRPLSLAGWKGREHGMAATAVVLIAVTVVLLLRPISWAAVGGQQPMPGVMTIPRLYIVFVPVAMALTSFILMRSLLRISHWSRALCVIGLALLAVNAGARVRIEAFSLVAGRATAAPPAAMHAVSSLAESGLLAEILAIVGACIAVRAAAPTSWRRHVAPWLIAAAFLLPVLGYLASLEFPAPLAAALHAHQVVTDASSPPGQLHGSGRLLALPWPALHGPRPGRLAGRHP